MIELDPGYFVKGWTAREWTWRNANAGAFIAPNIVRFQRRLGAVRAVINIGASSLLAFLRTNEYLNAYLCGERAQLHPVVGGPPAYVDPVRLQVDESFQLTPGREYFFAAASLEGTGVRYYGEYCMALEPTVLTNPQIVDRDSYEILFEPLKSSRLQNYRELVDILRGNWDTELEAMATLKVRIALERSERPATGVAEARALLEGDEFIEVHLHLPGGGANAPGFGRDAVEEIRLDARDLASGQRLESTFASRQPLSMSEFVFVWRRGAVERELRAFGVPSRVVREERAS